MVVLNIKERESSKKAWDILVTEGWGKCTLRYQRMVCARQMDQLHFIETETYCSGKMALKRVNRQVYRREKPRYHRVLYIEKAFASKYLLCQTIPSPWCVYSSLIAVWSASFHPSAWGSYFLVSGQHEMCSPGDAVLVTAWKLLRIAPTANPGK